ncbi:MAG: hypothetical protein AAFU03_10785, partial [Bacteroidota bacterium]
MKLLYLRLGLLVMSHLLCCSLSTQEVCDNGYDDDNDGLIDLHDTTDCICVIPSVVHSLLPNPSFEHYQSNCPQGPIAPGNADCLTGWQLASLGTTDAWNLLTYGAGDEETYVWPEWIPQPVPGGLGLAGFFGGIENRPDYREYLAACLPAGPLQAGQTYRFNAQIGFSNPALFSQVGINTFSNNPAELAIYGILNCEDIYFPAEGCPELAGVAEWELITNFTVHGQANAWQEANVDFVASNSYRALAIGYASTAVSNPPAGPGHWYNYYFIDETRLNTVTAFEVSTVGPVQIEGLHPCSEEIRLSVPQQSEATYQ